MLTLEEVIINTLQTAKEPIYEKLIFVKLLDNNIWNFSYSDLEKNVHDILIELTNKKIIEIIKINEKHMYIIKN
jgi:hypothetical protein